MKTYTLRYAQNIQTAISVLLGHFFAFERLCSKNNDQVTKPDSDSYWKFGDYTYTSGGSSQDGETTHGDFTAVVVSTSGDGGNYGAYSGSGLTFTFPSNLGAGKYVLTSDIAMVSDKGARQMEVTCTIGTAVNSGSVLYASTANSDGTADLTIDKDGKYHISIDKPVVLEKSTVVGGGISGAADAYSITVHNAY